MHEQHKDTIIKCFKSVGLSLLVNGSKDYLLNVRDLPNLTIGDWQKAPEGTKENPTIIDDTIDSNIINTIKVKDNKDSLLYTAKEVAEGITIKQEDKNDITTNLGVDSNKRFNPNVKGKEEGESDFNN